MEVNIRCAFSTMDVYKDLIEGYDYNLSNPSVISEWLTELPQPTQEELETAWLNYLAANYAKYRKAAYPDIGDQLDALWKIIEKLVDDNVDIGDEGYEMLDQIQTVKTTYPKP